MSRSGDENLDARQGKPPSSFLLPAPQAANPPEGNHGEKKERLGFSKVILER